MQDGPMNLLSLSEKDMYHIFEYLGDKVLIPYYFNYKFSHKRPGIHSLCQSYSLISKKFQETLDRYIRETPLVIGNEFNRYDDPSLYWACENRLKISRCNVYANGPNSATIAMNMLQKCDVSQVEHIRLYAAHCFMEGDRNKIHNAYDDGAFPYGYFGNKRDSIESLQTYLGDLAPSLQKLKRLEILSTRGELDFDMLKSFAKHCPGIENLSILYEMQRSPHCELLQRRDNSIDMLGEVVCQFSNLKKLKLDSKFESEFTGCVIKSETLEEIDLRNGYLALNECICPNLKVIKCQLDSLGRRVEFNGLTVTKSFVAEQAMRLQNEKMVQVDPHENTLNILGLQVPRNCVIEIHRGLWNK
ncbi:predicted protein [Chaetoceros tenuissimus]|uniref:Uncharacterized protein n=1 Tax=Chaetoceros tenuissimus TaxID=426638 RepID=A0AAD3CG16_9STRA|nr:predicted protein [Chaetoceros tenuissimus]